MAKKAYNEPETVQIDHREYLHIPDGSAYERVWTLLARAYDEAQNGVMDSDEDPGVREHMVTISERIDALLGDEYGAGRFES